MIYLAELLLELETLQTEVVYGKSKHIMFNNFFSENRAVYEIAWKNMVEPERLQMTLWRMRFSCWISKASNTHSVYVILIAFPLQQFFHECA
jgi:hypothetical protein